MEEKPARNDAENWTREYSTYFWSSSDPSKMRFETEKTMRLLLARDEAHTERLTYSGSDNPPFIGRNVRLRFEAALPKGNWYSLQITAWVPNTWNSETEFHSYADKAFEHWTSNLQTAPTLGLLGDASKELYTRRAQDAVDEEARRTSEKEDPAPVTALKHEILDGLRSGASFRTSHHEGGTTIYFDGKTFIRSEYGEQTSSRVLTTDEETLDCIQALYDWESRKDTFPHRPPELEAWRFIQRQLTK
jgi:hypothetical protein